MHDSLVRFYTRRAVIIKMTTIQQKCWLSGFLGFNLSQEAYIQCTSLIYGDVMHQNRYSQKKQSRKARSKWGTVIARYSKDGEIVAWQVRFLILRNQGNVFKDSSNLGKSWKLENGLRKKNTWLIFNIREFSLGLIRH